MGTLQSDDTHLAWMREPNTMSTRDVKSECRRTSLIETIAVTMPDALYRLILVSRMIACMTSLQFREMQTMFVGEYVVYTRRCALFPCRLSA